MRDNSGIKFNKLIMDMGLEGLPIIGKKYT